MDENKHWQEKGLPPVTARALERAGIRTMEDLAALTREEFVAFHALGEKAMRRCEALLGRPFPSARKEWLAKGLKPWAAWKLSFSRILTVEDLARTSAGQLRQLGLDEQDVGRLEHLAGRGETS